MSSRLVFWSRRGIQTTAVSPEQIADLTDGGATTLHSHAGGAVADGSITPAKLATGMITYVDVQVTNAQILTLKASPINLVVAPGAGYAWTIMHAHGVLDTRSGAYTANGGDPFLVLSQGSLADAFEPFSGEMFNLGAGLFTWEKANLYGGSLNEGAVDERENQPIRLSIEDVGFGGGDVEFGGGHADNTLSLRFYLAKVSTEPFGA